MSFYYFYLFIYIINLF